jgi:hypothetical protein
MEKSLLKLNLRSKINMINILFKEIMDIIYLNKTTPPYMIHLTNIKHILNLYPNIRFLNQDIKILTIHSNKLKKYDIRARDKYYELQDKLNHLSIEQSYLESCKTYTDLFHIYLKISHIINTIDEHLNLCKKEEINLINTNDNPITPQNTSWLYDLIKIYYKYQGVFPVRSKDFFIFFKNNYKEMKYYDQDDLIDIIDHVLGGYSYKELEPIIKNFDDWMKRNFSGLPENIKNYFML